MGNVKLAEGPKNEYGGYRPIWEEIVLDVLFGRVVVTRFDRYGPYSFIFLY